MTIVIQEIKFLLAKYRNINSNEIFIPVGYINILFINLYIGLLKVVWFRGSRKSILTSYLESTELFTGPGEKISSQFCPAIADILQHTD